MAILLTPFQTLLDWPLTHLMFHEMMAYLSWLEHCISEILLLFLVGGSFILPSVTSQICHYVLQQSKPFFFLFQIYMICMSKCFSLNFQMILLSYDLIGNFMNNGQASHFFLDIQLLKSWELWVGYQLALNTLSPCICLHVILVYKYHKSSNELYTMYPSSQVSTSPLPPTFFFFLCFSVRKLRHCQWLWLYITNVQVSFALHWPIFLITSLQCKKPVSFLLSCSAQFPDPIYM